MEILENTKIFMFNHYDYERKISLVILVQFREFPAFVWGILILNLWEH